MTGAVIATLLSMMLTAYLIKYDEQLYALSKPVLAPVERLFGLRGSEHHHAHEQHKPTTIIVGVNPMSAAVVELLAEKNVLVIDQNPKKLASYHDRGIKTLCSDIYNVDLYEELIDFSALKTVVSTIGDTSANVFLIRKMHHANKNALIIATAQIEDEGRRLYRAGASLVLVPDVTGKRLLAELLETGSANIHSIGKIYQEELGKHFVYLRE
jgi:hypothetical protein